MSRFIESLCATANGVGRITGFVTGEPAHGLRRTWWEVHEQACRMAGGLLGSGMRRGARVAVLAALPVQVAPTIQAVWLAGGSVTMLHQPTPRTDLGEWAESTSRILRTLNVDLVLGDTTFAPLLGQASIRFRMIDELDADPLDEPAHSNGEDFAVVQLTNGATGAPKVVGISHDNLIANMTAMTDRTRLEPGHDVMISWLPMFHDMGMIGFLTLPMTLGLELVKITPLDFVGDPFIWFELITKYRATIVSASADAYGMMARRLETAVDPGGFDLSTVRVAMVGGEPIDAAAMREFMCAAECYGLAPNSVVPAYGMAEATVAAAFELGRGLRTDVLDVCALQADGRAVPAPAWKRRNIMPYAACELVRLGRPLPEISVRVIDKSGAVLPERTVGEIQLSGRSISSWYVASGGPVASVNVEGWLPTGDLGYLVDGEIVICGRLQDAISYEGRTILPTDIERAAGGVNGVRPHTVVAIRLCPGTDNESFGVVVESDVAGDERAERVLAVEVADRVMAEVDVSPRAVIVAAPGSVPKTSSGKRRRSAVASIFANQIDRIVGE